MSKQRPKDNEKWHEVEVDRVIEDSEHLVNEDGYLPAWLAFIVIHLSQSVVFVWVNVDRLFFDNLADEGVSL